MSASEDLEAVDVLQAARAIMMEPGREIMDSQREVRAMALMIDGFDTLAAQAAYLVKRIELLGEAPSPRNMAAAHNALLMLHHALHLSGYMERVRVEKPHG
jgi:hypothetical protein